MTIYAMEQMEMYSILIRIIHESVSTKTQKLDSRVFIVAVIRSFLYIRILFYANEESFSEHL